MHRLLVVLSVMAFFSADADALRFRWKRPATGTQAVKVVRQKTLVTRRRGGVELRGSLARRVVRKTFGELGDGFRSRTDVDAVHVAIRTAAKVLRAELVAVSESIATEFLTRVGEGNEYNVELDAESAVRNSFAAMAADIQRGLRHARESHAKTERAQGRLRKLRAPELLPRR